MQPVDTSVTKHVRAKPGESSVHLDQAGVRGLPKPTKEQGSRLWLDDQLPGFCVQITYTGTRTFRLRYRKAGKWYSVKIGRWRDGKEPVGKIDPGGSSGQRGLTAAQARAKAAELRRELDGGGNPARDAKLKEAEQAIAERGLVKVKDAWRDYMAYAKGRGTPMAASSIDQAQKSYANHIEPRMGDRYLSSLTSEDVEVLAGEVGKIRRMRGKRQEGGPSAARHAIAHLSAFLTWAVKRKLVDTNVAKMIDRGDVLAPENKRERYLNPKEWAAVMHELDDWPYVTKRGSRFADTKTVRLDAPQLRQLVSCEALRIALVSGARKSEVFKMRWADVDMESGWWKKPKATVKTGKGHEVQLPAMALDSLRKLKEAHGDPLFPFPGKLRLDKLQAGQKPKGEEGGPIQDVHELWGRIRRKLGLDDVTIHDLRHTAASVLISHGASLFEVGEALGHTQAQTTMRYAKLLREAKQKTASRMDAFAAENYKPQADGAKSAKRPNRVR